MRKLLKKVLVLLLAAVIAAAAPVSAHAQPVSQDVSMETALVAVKSVIDIDDDLFTDFSYSSSFSNYETREGLIWYFHWSADNAYIHAAATADGTLLYFNKYLYDSKYFGFAEFSIDEAISIADEFIQRASPRTYTYFKAPADVGSNLHNSDIYLSYTAEVNGYAFPAAYLFVSVNKFTGEVTGYSRRNVDPGRFKFESADGLIGVNEAVTAYAEKIGLALEYKSSFDYENNKITVFPAYMFKSHGDRFISARTGDVVEYVYDLGAEGDDIMSGGGSSGTAPLEASADASEGSRGANITPAERAAIEQVAGFLTSEQALRKLLEAAELTDLNVESFDEQYISLGRDYLDNSRYFYNVNLYKYLEWDAADDEITGLFGRVDATTGRVMSFSFFYHGMPVSSDGKTLSIEQAGAAVEAFLKKNAQAELAKSRLDESPQTAAGRFGPSAYNYHFNYVRYEGAVPFRDNGINVTFNPNTGKVTSYSLNWFENVTFPGVSGVITPQSALSVFAEQNGSSIIYVTTGEGNASLVYDFKSHSLIDPFSGKAIDHSGKPVTDTAVTPAYGDVAGHWSEKYVTRLLENGVYMWGGRFEPDKVMTELEFLQYIMLIEPYYLARMEPQSFFAQRGINVEASPDKNLTRQEAVRIIVEYLGYGKLAEQSKWFVYPFNDRVAEEYKGYVTICYMLGIVTGDASGRFNAASNVTRAQAAVMLHNLILVQG